jgi:hypothetical protein
MTLMLLEAIQKEKNQSPKFYEYNQTNKQTNKQKKN